MTSVFADTFYYLALLNRDDAAHDDAAQFTISYAGTMVTTDWVLTELADGLSSVRTRRTVIDFVEDLQHDRAVRVIPASRRRLQQGWRLYRTRPDKAWSLTDCISFVVMRDRGITEVLTGDRHFEQAGFTTLLK